MKAAGVAGLLNPNASPRWLRPLVDNVGCMPAAYRRRLPADVLAMVTAVNAKAKLTGAGRDAAVLVLFSGPPDADPGRGVLDEVDLLLTVRASTLRHHAGQAAFPGGATDPGDGGPVDTALREAREETGIDATRVRALATLEKMFIGPSGYHVVPVLAYSPDPGPVTVVDETETAAVTRVPLRAFINPENRLMVYKRTFSRRFAGPAFLLNEMLVWGFTGQVISAMLDVADWAQPWDSDTLLELDDAMALVGSGARNGSPGHREVRWGHPPASGWGPRMAGEYPHPRAGDESGVGFDRQSGYGEAQP